MRNRWYDTRAGRFISEDPIGLAGGPNLYAFGGGDPVGGWDPTGLLDTMRVEARCPPGKIKVPGPLGSHTCLDPADVSRLLGGGRPQGYEWNSCDNVANLMPECGGAGQQFDREMRRVFGPLIRAAETVNSARRCAASSLAFSTNVVSSTALVVGTGFVAYGVVSGTSASVAWGISGASTSVVFSRAGSAAQRGFTIIGNELAPDALGAIGAGADIVAGNFGWKSLVPFVGLEDAYRAVATNCPVIF